MQYSSGTGMRRSSRPRRRVRIRPRFFIFLLLLVAIIIGCVFGIRGLIGMIAGPQDATVSLGVLEDVKSFDALILRDEEIVRIDTYETILYKATEGQNVTAGDDVLDVFTSGYSEELNRQLEETQAEVRRLQQQVNPLGNVVDEDLMAFDTHIAQKEQEIQSAARGAAVSKIVDLEKELRSLMEQRQDLIQKTQATFDNTELQAKLNDLERLERQIAAFRSPYKASSDGRVSFTSDGMEYFLNMDSLDSIAVADVQNMLKGTLPGTVPPEIKAAVTLYRLVNPTNWYALIPVKDWSYAVGFQGMEISFAGYEGITFVANVKSIHEGEGDHSLVVLEVTEDIGPLMNARSATVKIGGRIEGYVVPLSAIKEVGGRRGVYLLDGVTFVEISVLGRDDENALVMPLNEGELSKEMKVLRK